MRRIKHFSLAALLFSSLLTNAQLQQKNVGQTFNSMPPTRTCGTPEAPHDFETWLQPLLASGNVQRTVYTIPVIVHVIHNGESLGSGSNISAAQVQSQIDILNEDYRALNADISSVPSAFSGVVADCEINFCAAVVDPSGNLLTEPGIHRVNRSTAGFSAPPYANTTYIDNTIKPATIWDVNQYLNIWVLDLGGGLLGYATFPNPGSSGLAGLSAPYGTTTTDGVVILYTAFGDVGNVAAPYNKGRTATHEIGHWLGLRHIWGDANCGTDYCNDTPTQQTSNGGCPTFPHVTCSNGPNGDMFMNYMDYVNDACMFMFTANQKARVQAIMQFSPIRVNLATSTKCTPPFALDAGISAIVRPTGSSCGTTYSPVVTLRNYGSSTLTSCTIQYSVDGGATSNFNWTGTLTSGSTTNVTLPNITVGVGAHTYAANTTSPNGGTDQNNANNSSSSSFTVTTAPAGAALPFTQGFQGTTFIPTGWTLTNPDANVTWARVTTAGGFGTSTASAKMDNFSSATSIAGQVDYMITPALSFVGANSTLKMDFNVAHARYNGTLIDSLAISISTDCGGSWTRLYIKGGSTLATAPDVTTAFTPTAAQWRAETVNLGSYAGQSSVLIRFESISGWGNNVYIDDINLYYTASGSAPVAAFSGTPTTVCAGQSVSFTDASTNTPTSWSWTFTGGTPSTSTSQNPTVTYSTPGTYAVALTATNANGSNTLTQTGYITVNAVPTVTAGSNSPVCAGSALNLTGNTIAGATYAWSGPNGFTSSLEDPTIATSAVANAGTYTLTITNNGCSASGTTAVTVNAAPTATASSNSPLCSGATLNLSTPTVAGATYAWSGPGGYTSAIRNPSRTNVTTAMAGTYTVTVTAGGCSSTSSVTVTINATPTATAGSNSPVCAGTAINLTGNTVAGATYAWSGPNAFTSSLEDPSIASAVAANAGTYTLTVTNNGCSATSTTAVTVNAAPTATASSNSPICAGATLNLSTPTVAGATYAWSGPGGYTSAIRNPSRTNVTTAMAGTYTVTVTGSNGCSSTSSVNVTINQTTATASSNSPVCAGAAINLTAATVAGGTYAWSGPNGFTNATQNPSIAGATAAMAGSYTLTVTANGCSGTSTTNVVVNALPVVTASSNSPVCSGAGNSIQLNATTIAGATYAWTGPGTYTSAVQNPVRNNPTTAMGGTYTVTATDANGCSGTSSVSVTVNASPTATASSNSPICEGATLTLSTPTVSAATYAWSGPGGYTAAIRNPTRTNATTAMSGTYTVTVTKNGCTATSSVNVTINPQPTATAGSTSPVCEGDLLDLTANTVAGATYAWSGPNGFTSAAEDTSFTVSALNAGTYTLTINNGCTASSTTTVTINPNPISAAYNTSPVCEGQSIDLTCDTVPGASYSWNGPNGFTANTAATSVSGNLNDAGNYTLTVTLNGCSSSYNTSITVNALPVVDAGSDVAICEGSSSNLNAAGAATYVWSPSAGLSSATSSNPTASPISTTTYTLSGTNANGCVGTDAITVTVHPLPSNPVVTQNSGTLSSTAANSYQWYLNGNPIPGATSQTYTPTQDGDYTVEITDANGCTAISTTVVVAGTGFNDLAQNAFLHLYPNPADAAFTIELQSPWEGLHQVEIYNAVGQIVYTSSLVLNPGSLNRIGIDASALERGAYSVRVLNADYQVVKTIVLF